MIKVFSVFVVILSIIWAFNSSIFQKKTHYKVGFLGDIFPVIHNKIDEIKEVNKSYFERDNSVDNILIDDAVPGSLQGVFHEVRLMVDSEGNLIINEGIKQLFEFYLSAMGEESLDKILARIQRELNRQLDSHALSQAQSLLKRFVDYKTELAELDAQSDYDRYSQIELIKRQKLQLSDLRNRTFSLDEYSAFFEQEDIYDNFMIRQLSISQHQDLDDLTKQQKLEILDKTLPESLRVVREKVTKHADIYTKAVLMREEGGSDEEVHQMRAEALGYDAAQSMANLDASRRVWQQRLEVYAERRNQIIASGMPKQDVNLAIEELINNDFHGAERIRVKALDRFL